MISQEEKTKYQTMNMQDRGKWLKAHMEEILADIRSKPRLQMLKEWPFGNSTLLKIMRAHTPELVKKLKQRSSSIPKKDPRPKVVKSILPPFPDFKDNWLMSTQEKWMDIWKEIYLKEKEGK